MPITTPITIPAMAPVEIPERCGVGSCEGGDAVAGEDEIEAGDDAGDDTEADAEGDTDDSEPDAREVAKFVEADVGD